MRQYAAGVTWADGMGWRDTGIAGPSVSDEVIKSDSSVEGSVSGAEYVGC
jgi:hypothetical protein